MPLPITTDRLVIRALGAADAADVAAVYGDDRVMRHFNSNPVADRLEARAWAVEQGELQSTRGYAQWHVREREGGRFVGCLGLQPLGDEVELLYAFVPEAWGRGYATEAARAALEYAFGEAGMDRVVAIARRANEASLRVLRRLGMRYHGEAEYWDSPWEKFSLTPRQARHDAEAARLPLSTPRLDLRLLEDDDLEAMFAVFGDPAVMRFVGATRQPLSRDELAASQVRVRAHWHENGFGPLAVVERASGGVIGEAGLQILEAGPEIEVTYTLARAAWGRGYATEAARAALVWGFDGLRLQRIVAVAYPQNAASLHVLEKLGMRQDGRQFCYGADLARFTLAIDDWRAGDEAPPARL